MIPEFTSSYWIFTMLPVRRLGHNPVLVRPIQQGDHTPQHTVTAYCD